jgi:hypothetical protein
VRSGESRRCDAQRTNGVSPRGSNPPGTIARRTEVRSGESRRFDAQRSRGFETSRFESARDYRATNGGEERGVPAIRRPEVERIRDLAVRIRPGLSRDERR